MNKTILLKECLSLNPDYIVVTCNRDIAYIDRIRNKSSECYDLVVNTFDLLNNDLGTGSMIDVEFIKLMNELRIDTNNFSLCIKVIKFIAPLTSI